LFVDIFSAVVLSAVSLTTPTGAKSRRFLPVFLMIAFALIAKKTPSKRDQESKIAHNCCKIRGAWLGISVA